MKEHCIFKWLGTQNQTLFDSGSVGQVDLATRQKNWEG